MINIIKRLFSLKRKRTWHDYNAFERKMWGTLFREKKSELQRRFGHSVECHKLAKQYADRQMRCSRYIKEISDANKSVNKNTDVISLSPEKNRKKENETNNHLQVPSRKKIK